MDELMKAIIAAILIVSLACYCYADEELTLVDIIDLSPDSLQISSVNSIGDFNADGYGDLLLKISAGWPSWYEAAYLYYGGPNFDTQPDLIFVGEQQGESIGFGGGVKLNDFNGDGFDDMAINCPGHGHGDIYQGRIYLHWGSPSPDTITDLIIDGERYWDCLGASCGGDINGDGMGDIVMVANNLVMGARVLIYLGNSVPDTICDIIYDYSEQYDVRISEVYSGIDLNGDGYDEYGYEISGEDGEFEYIYSGSDTLNQHPDYILDHFIYPIGDISLDGIDDIIISMPDWYLCLGGNPFDIEPDYFMCENSISSDAFLYNLTGVGKVILKENSQEHLFYLYHTGIPFDTTIYSTFDYIHSRSGNSPCIGDINGDGIDDLALRFANDSLVSKVYIYSIMQTDIEDNPSIPNKTELIYCYPNPFNSSTVITYSLEEGGEIGIYDITGRLVRNYSTGDIKEGPHGSSQQDWRAITWDGTNANGQKVSSGLYFVRLSNSQSSVSTKLIFMK